MKLHPDIISTEIIKPSSPTPSHLKTYKLSLLDQLSPNIYFPFIFFYSEAIIDSINIAKLLKSSLSETLTHYYPFAGQVQDDFSFVDCNDHGVPFIEAHISNKIHEIMKNPDIDTLEELLPSKPSKKLSNRVNLAVQLNYFDCGGVAISVCFNHLVADATAAAYFVKNWSTIALDSSNSASTDINDVILDCTAMFPST
ncbi:Vinorine synthase [Melia azedarach]|uniref:Vinorine synthase n=1 Tax=Melia azedarach TaxID=155640 RepID=A0ACC1YID2_MELAZ|nr:Vinorine synthase [Melia azedarach]